MSRRPQRKSPTSPKAPTSVEVTAMNALHPQYVVDENQTPTAVLFPIPEWEQVVEDLEELDDIRAFDLAKSGTQETIPFEQAVRQIRV